VWSSLGLFPVAGQNLFLVNTPAFAYSKLAFGGNTFEIETTGHRETGIGAEVAGRTPEPQYVQAVTLNGRTLDHSFISGNDLHAGGRLHVELGPEPSTWATKSRPPSTSDRNERPHPVTRTSEVLP
jgi:putative alpha-1,2-mannosidase